MSLKVTDTLVQEYVSAAGMTAVTILTFRGRAKLGHSQDTHERRKALVLERIEMFDEVWFQKLHHAEMVIEHCRGEMDASGVHSSHGWREIEPAQLRDMVVNSAAAVGTSWASREEVYRDATAAVSRIVDSLIALNSCGGLGEINRAYKRYRGDVTVAGKKAMFYRDYLAGFAASVIRLIGASTTTEGRARSLLSGPKVLPAPNDPMVMFSPALLASIALKARPESLQE